MRPERQGRGRDSRYAIVANIDGHVGATRAEALGAYRLSQGRFSSGRGVWPLTNSCASLTPAWCCAQTRTGRNSKARGEDGAIGRLTLVLETWARLDAGHVQALTRQLRRELLHLDVDSVDLARQVSSPEGAKGGAGAEVLGGLVVVAALSRPLLRALVDVTRAWLQRSGQRSIRIVVDGDELEIQGSASRDMTHLADVFIERHGMP
jgi:hypothetical protein